MNVEQVLDLVISILDKCAVPYMVAGSFASNIHGLPRTTYDADMVVDMTSDSLRALLDELGDRFYVDPEAAGAALASRGMFNIIHLDTGFKIDLIVRKARPYSIEEFRRRVQAPLAGRRRWFASPEDVILTKLEWSMLGESERQFNDALNVAQIQAEQLDLEYLQRWADRIGVQDSLARLLRELAS